MLARIVLCLLLAASPVFGQANSVAVEALSRLKGMDLEANPTLKGAVLRVLETTRGTPQFVEIVRDFKLTGHAPALVEFAAANPTNSIGVEALKLAVDEAGLSALKSTNEVGLVQAVGNTSDKQFVPFLTQSLTNAATRRAAALALAQTEEGAGKLIELAKADQLDASVKFVASAALATARWPEIKAQAAEVLPLPQGQNAALPPLAELVKMKGDAARGAKIYRKPEVNCISCHQVNGEGVDFGPALTEIGTKLAKEALYEAILDPSAGISFGYEAWQLETKDGEEPYGIIASETADEVTLKTQNGISTKYKKGDLAKRTQSKLSIMPAGLQQAMSTQDLVDLVEYLASLKKAP